MTDSHTIGRTNKCSAKNTMFDLIIKNIVVNFTIGH